MFIYYLLMIHAFTSSKGTYHANQTDILNYRNWENLKGIAIFEPKNFIEWYKNCIEWYLICIE
jgi:hypothetical protein